MKKIDKKKWKEGNDKNNTMAVMSIINPPSINKYIDMYKKRKGLVHQPTQFCIYRE
jgi:hypothetical protein